MIISCTPISERSLFRVNCSQSEGELLGHSITQWNSYESSLLKKGSSGPRLERQLCHIMPVLSMSTGGIWRSLTSFDRRSIYAAVCQ